jgi:hypothetical protein
MGYARRAVITDEPFVGHYITILLLGSCLQSHVHSGFRRKNDEHLKTKFLPRASGKVGNSRLAQVLKYQFYLPSYFITLLTVV